MTPERYRLLRELFDQARRLAPGGRAAFLDAVCAGDPALGAELEGLLAQDQRGEVPFPGPCPANAGALPPPDGPRAAPTGEPDDALVGRKVGPYLIEQRLGSGGLGSVYRARRQGASRQQVAVKVIRPGPAGAEILRRFQDERQALADLAHPHIARLLDGGATEDGRPYFVAEYIDGEPLDRHCEGRQLSTRRRVELLRSACAAVQYAHERGVLHGDLKPANVLVTADGRAKVTDFGLARRPAGGPGGSGQTRNGAVLGTPSYLAPEQVGRGKEVSPATDVYGLGATLYELLTGRPPFRGQTPLDTLLQVVSQEPEPPSRLHPKLARDLEAVCLKCLEKDPRRRYAGAGEVADDLGRFLAGAPVRPRRAGAAGRALKWALAAAVVVLVLAGGVTAWLLRQHRADAEQRAGSATAAVRRQATGFREEAARLARAEKTRDLLRALLDVSAPREPRATRGDEAGRVTALAQPSADEQYAGAFRRWGLDVDGTAESDAVARLRQEADAVVQEVIAGLDNWMLERRRQNHPEGHWRRLARVAERLDRNERRRQLRALLLGELPPPAASVAGLLGVGPPWAGLWALGPGDRWRQLRQLRSEVAAAGEPVLTVVLLAQASAAVGDAAGAEQLLRRALAARPNEVVLLGALGRLLEQRDPPRLGEAVECYRATRAARPGLGIALGRALVEAGRAAEGEAVLRDLVRRQPDNPERHFYLANALCRQKKAAEAEAAYRQALELRPDLAVAHAALGLALLDQGRFAEAEETTRRCLLLLPPNDPRRKPVTQNLREAQRLAALDEKLSAVDRGQANPVGAAERVALAELCRQHKQRHAAAARFYAEAFAEQPTLAEDLRAGHRYAAARAAALAADGQGKGADQPDDQERARLRRRALDWLRADLNAWATLAQKSAPEARQEVRDTLTHWRRDADLAGVREPAALARLPEEERRAWQKLWADVAALLSHAERMT